MLVFSLRENISADEIDGAKRFDTLTGTLANDCDRNVRAAGEAIIGHQNTIREYNILL